MFILLTCDVSVMLVLIMMRNESLKQLTDGRTEIGIYWAPVGAKNDTVILDISMLMCKVLSRVVGNSIGLLSKPKRNINGFKKTRRKSTQSEYQHIQV